MSLPLLRLAVVGHTNTGKTSLLRTLTRNVDFGEVSPHPATTRHVEGTSILLAGTKVLELYDTPGGCRAACRRPGRRGVRRRS